MVAVGRLGFGSLEVVRRPWHVAVRRARVRLPCASPAQRHVRTFEFAAHRLEALVCGLVMRTIARRSPEPVLLGTSFSIRSEMDRSSTGLARRAAARGLEPARSRWTHDAGAFRRRG